MRRSLPLAFDIGQSIGQDIGSPITGLDIAYQVLLDLFSASEEGVLVPSINDARAEGRLWQDSAQTTLATAADDPVGLVEDFSGNGNDLSQGTATARPLLKQDGSGDWYLLGDGVDDIITASSAITVKEGFYWAAACQIVSRGGASNDSIFSTAVNTGSGVTSADACGIYERSDSVERLVAGLRVGVGTAFSTTLESAFTIGSNFIGEAYHESDTLYSSNVSSSANSAADDNNTSANQEVSIFGSGSASMRFYGGICVMRETTAAEKTAVRDYLASQSGVTL